MAFPVAWPLAKHSNAVKSRSFRLRKRYVNDPGHIGALAESGCLYLVRLAVEGSLTVGPPFELTVAALRQSWS
ncbi:hypothetical protein GCM10010306_025560 [Streptomyces umbrinus]|nr:hypothetical protein GCM10010306_025560 [Streptomyces umbrinus]